MQTQNFCCASLSSPVYYFFVVTLHPSFPPLKNLFTPFALTLIGGGGGGGGGGKEDAEETLEIG